MNEEDLKEERAINKELDRALHTWNGTSKRLITLLASNQPSIGNRLQILSLTDSFLEKDQKVEDLRKVLHEFRVKHELLVEKL